MQICIKLFTIKGGGGEEMGSNEWWKPVGVPNSSQLLYYALGIGGSVFPKLKQSIHPDNWILPP